MQEMTATELKQKMDEGRDIQLIDVREPNEYEVARIPNSIHIPLGQILNRMSEISRPVFFFTNPALSSS
jgi:adenylyltransferase/sulfurtransferase